jgi:hypothetical protein
VSEFDFENIKVSTTGDLVNFGNLTSNAKSEFIIFEAAYRYAFVEFQIGSETFTFQPIDYVGETLLSNGKYNYEINVNPDSEFQKVILELRNE